MEARAAIRIPESPQALSWLSYQAKYVLYLIHINHHLDRSGSVSPLFTGSFP